MNSSKMVGGLLIAFLFAYWPSNLPAQSRPRSFSAFPILNYGSDAGFGFDGKGVLKNQWQRDESLDGARL